MDECYLKELKDWFDGHNLAFPFDVLNFHNYSNTDGYHGLGEGISPEDDDLQAKLKHLDLVRDNYFPTKELWLSEFGYNTLATGNPQMYALANSYLVPVLGDEDRYEIQGQWIVRSFLAAAAADFDKAFVYEIRDATDNPDALWDHKCGLLESMYDGFQPKKSWFYTFTLRNVLAGMDYIEEVQSGSLTCNANQPRIYKFADPSNSSDEIYAIWSPTSCDNQTYNFSPSFTNGWTAAHYIKMEVPSTTGITVNVTPIGGQFYVPVSERPIFLKPGPAPNPDVACPDNLMVDNITCSSVILNWDIPPGMNYDHYQIWYGPVTGIDLPSSPDIFSDDITLFQQDVPGNFEQALVGNLDPNTQYYF